MSVYINFIHNRPKIWGKRCSLMTEWVRKPIEYLNHGILVVKKNELIHTTTLINLQGIMLSEKKAISLR